MQPTDTLASIVQKFATEWLEVSNTGETIASTLSCTEFDAIADVFRAVGAGRIADWIGDHAETEEACQGHAIAPLPLYDESDNYTPVPGTEYPFSVSDIARATALILGPGWTAESGTWGVSGTLSGPCSTDFTFYVDYEGDLTVDYQYSTDDHDFPEEPQLPEGVRRCDTGVCLEGACSVDGLEALAQKCAATIRAVTGR
ncbi:hypothetical protein [Streptomyces sp. NPDC046976]|uniref:hypothetical protein n=1 Tax=Streptomyces sp. NPDC046976 TaxID=3155258 RepID=UPI0033F7EC1F